MALRPVSELGLVDLTDLASQKVNHGAAPRPAGRGASASNSKTSAGRSPRRPTKTPRNGGPTKQPRVRASTSQGSKRSPSASKRSADTRRTVNADLSAGGNRQRRRPRSRIGLSVATGALGVAGGLLLSRGALQR